MSEPTVVGLDMSLTATGFCLKRGTELNVETIKTTPKTAENDLARLQYIVKEVLRRIPADVKMVCIEDYFIPQSKMQFGAAIKLCQLGTLMRVAMYNKGIPFMVPTAPQLKKFATGKGNCNKSIVVREVYKRWGVEATDDNQADACTLAHMAGLIEMIQSGNLTGNEPTKFQMETTKKVMDERPKYNIDG